MNINRRETWRLLATLVLSVAWSSVFASCGSRPIFIQYELYKTINSDKERRSVQTSLQINENGLFQYSRSDYALGSLNSLVEDYSESFFSSNRDPAWFQKEAIHALAAGLIANNVSNLKSGREPIRTVEPPDHLSHIYLRCGELVHQVFYFTEPEAVPLAAAISLIQDYLSRTLSNLSPRRSSLVTQGDAVVPVAASVSELLKHPERYNGKRVKVDGYYALRLEYSNLKDAKFPEENLWIDTTPSSFGVVAAFDEYSGTRVSIEGVFIYRPRQSGHLGGWDGEIKRVTRIQRVN